MAADPNWGRWVYASMSRDFETRFKDVTEVFFEGEHRGLPTDRSLLEFRMDGPRIREPHRGQFTLDVSFNILVQIFMDDQEINRVRQLPGEVAQWLGKDHCVYRLGSGSKDDFKLLGTLVYQTRGRLEGTNIAQFGQIDSDKRIEQAAVEAPFKMFLTPC